MSDSRNDQLNADSSVSTFTSALWFNAALSAGFFVAFNVLRQTRPRVYAPRSYATEPEKRPPPLRKGYLLWMYDMLKIPDETLIRTMGLDRFMILKFLRMGIILFSIATVIIVPILIPINVIDQHGSPGLNLLTMGNIKDSPRTWAHLVLSVLLSAGVIYYTYRETRRYLTLRRSYLLSPEYANSVMARTILVSSIPSNVNSVSSLEKIFNQFPGGVRRVWLNRKMKDLPDDVDKRQKYVQNLEGAVTKAILASYKHYAKKNNHVEAGQEPALIPEKLRPTHRVSSLPFPIPCVGRKVDSIEYYKGEIHQLNEKITTNQQSVLDESSPDAVVATTGDDLGKAAFPQMSSAFIEFNRQVAAHMAAQTVIHHKELQMAPRYIQVAPTDIIWDNMDIGSLNRFFRRLVSIVITTAIVIFWAIPVVFIQAVANLETLSKTFTFLSVVQSLGPTVVGIIQGILPAVALAILIALVPIIFTYLSQKEGIPQKSFVDLSVLHKYFFFQFVDVVLISTIAGGIANIISLAENPIGVINVLAENLPRASTFFITFVMLQATNGSAQSILQLVPYLLSYLFTFFATTPRDIYNLKAKCPNVNIGTLIPTQTVVFVLGLEYSTIAPLILPFVCLFFYIQYFVYLYQFLYVYELEYETGGRAFPRAIRHVYIGLFTWQLTMIGLFAVRGGTAIGQLVVMVITLIVSIFALVLYDKSFKPMFKYLPVDQDFPKAITEPASGISTSKLDSDLHRPPTKDDDNKGLVQGNEPHPAGSHATKKEHSEPAQAGTSSDNKYQLEEEHHSVKEQPCVDAYRERREMRQKLMGATSHEVNDTTLSNAKTMYEAESYMHPSLRQLQPTVWLPREDKFGITARELEELRSLSVSATSDGAYIQEKAKGKGAVKVDKDIIEGGKGMPGEQPKPGELSRVNDYVRVVVDNYNFVNALGMTSG